MSVIDRYAGFIPTTTATELEERAHRERRLAKALVDSGDHSLPVLKRVMDHEARAEEFERRLKQERGW